MVNFTPATGLATQKALVIDGAVYAVSWVGSTGGSGVDTFFLSRNNIQSTVSEVIPAISTSTPTFSFTQNLQFGVVNSDVKFLQKYLNTKGYTVSKSGIGSVGKESTRFGSATRAALIKLQKFAGISTTGFFGPLTRQYVNSHQ